MYSLEICLFKSLAHVLIELFFFFFFCLYRKHVCKAAVKLKNLPPNSGDLSDKSSISGLGRSPGKGNGNSLQYFCLENPMDWGAWQTMVHRVTKSQTRLKRFSIHAHWVIKPPSIAFWSFQQSFPKFLKYYQNWKGNSTQLTKCINSCLQKCPLIGRMCSQSKSIIFTVFKIDRILS